ncbi:MAG: hypothetical protein IKI84_06370 [Clostridia bacterium]|nr:hypothetical protein [Clostridia bacterium]
MAKDDYHVIVYRVLQHLYKQLKEGLPPDKEIIGHEGKACRINEEYWKYIIVSMQEEGLIRGLKKAEGQDEYECTEDTLKNIRITPKGIEQLSDSKLTDRVDKLIRDVIKLV